MGRLRVLFHLTGGVLSLVLSAVFATSVALILGLLFWLQTAGSLEHALRMVAAALPAGQSLQTRGVTGSVRDGGHIDYLVWRKGELLVEGLGLDLAWDWRGLLEGQLRVAALHAQSLRVTDHNPANAAPFSQMPLPLLADVQFSVDRLDWIGPPAYQVEALRGHYRFDGTTHRVQDVTLRMADGSYQGHADLQALEPMALTVQVHGEVRTAVKIQQAPLLLQAQASAHGTLAGPDASLEVALDLQPHGSAKSRPLGAMQATVQATIRPAQAQPIARAHGQWTALNLASLWPQAPQTNLSGQAQVLPDGAGWSGSVQLQNNAPGPLDQQRLPLESADARLQYRNGQWLLSALQAHGAGGAVQAQGRFDGNPALWSVTATLQGLLTRQLDSRLPSATLDGRIAARQTAEGVSFDSQLLAPMTARDAAGGAQTDTAPGLRLEAKGVWRAPLLQLESLRLQTPQALVSGPLQIDTASYASRGHLRAILPGAQLELDGNLAADTGQGSSLLQVSDVQALSRWLQALPIVGSGLPTADAQGDLDVSARWSGGWQNLGADLKVEASATSKRLDVADSYHLRDLKLGLGGTLRALAVQVSGKAQSGTQQLALAAHSQVSQTGDGQWRARLDGLDFSVSDGLKAKPWTLQLQQPVNLDWQHNALNRSLAVAAGSMRLSGPAPGAAKIEWQAAQWTQAVANGQVAGAPRWNTHGEMQGVPLAWLEALGQTRIANLGLRGDLVFAGQWDASVDGTDKGLQVRARLQRSSGDLQLLSAEANGGLLQAGLRDAHVDVQVVRNALHANLVWASDAGGNAQADFNTQLRLQDGSWDWAADAPVQASVQANLPRVGAWSLIAPVGWRINGTLEADVQLSGTRSQPAWKGSLLARNMSVRSAVEGIDFSNGLLRLQIDGQHMDIAELTLQGAGGAAGGQLLATGSVDWLPGAPGEPLASHLRMALDAKAQALRVTARPDQRLVVSGNLAARLIDTRLILRGILLADQALFVLPEDNTPKLGSDVVVKRGKPAPGSADPAADKPPSRTAQALIPDLNIVLDPGPNFQVQGHGLKTRLTGLLTLEAQGRDMPPRLTGELHTVSGTYRAYGQSLRIEDGSLRFAGAYDNPVLDIRAVRPNLSQVVGVEVSGTAQFPVVRLYSEPDLPEAEKLSWLVLGRSSANGGAETAMLQQAALALLAGRGVAPTEGIGKAFGLDELSLGQIATTNLDGTTGSEATVRLGKRISRDFYVAYERGLAGTLGTFYVFYDLSRRFTLRGESGIQNAVDLIFTTRYD
jgi:translocation and assembly module TamB